MEIDENGSERGLHIVLVNPDNGDVEFAKVFDTDQSSELFDELIAKENAIPDGYIIVAAGRDDCVAQLSEASKEWFRSIGSKEIFDLESG